MPTKRPSVIRFPQWTDRHPRAWRSKDYPKAGLIKPTQHDCLLASIVTPTRRNP